MTDEKHKHKWVDDGKRLTCSCGKEKLKLDYTNTEVAVGIRSDGSNYSVRINRDRIFKPAEWRLFYNSLKTFQQFTFKLLLLTGARINEARHIKVEDIELEEQRITLKVTKQRKDNNNKSKTRTLRVSKELIKDIKKRIINLNLKDNDYLKVLSIPAAWLAMRHALERTPIKDYKMFSIHSVRKTSENWARALGIDSITLSSRFGHNLTTQYENYSQSDAFTQEEKNKIKEYYGDTFI